MKPSLLAVSALAGLASSQCVSSIPECARDCLVVAAGSVGCGETDYACQCTSQHQTDITTNATTCVLAGCGQQVAISRCPPVPSCWAISYPIAQSPRILTTGIDEVLPAADAFCSAINAGESCSSASAGVTSTGTSSASGSTSSQDSTRSTSVSQTGTGTGTEATATTGSLTSASGTAETTGSSATGTATGASASASSTAAAAKMGSVGSLGVAVLGALFML